MIDFVASQPHYADHLAPLWTRIEGRGRFYASDPVRRHLALRWGIAADPYNLDDHGRHLVTASSADVPLWTPCAPERVAMLEHGAGQRYDQWDLLGILDTPGLFLTPTVAAATRTALDHPAAQVEVVGCPYLSSIEGMRAARIDGRFTITFAFHWDQWSGPQVCRSAFPWYLDTLRSLVPALAAGGYDVIGHGHPRGWGETEPEWRAMGARPLPWWPEVAARTDLLVVDNSSILWEAAHLGIRTVAVDSPDWGDHGDHGLRFGAPLPGGHCPTPGQLEAAIRTEIAAAPRRHSIYPHSDPDRAVAVLDRWAA